MAECPDCEGVNLEIQPDAPPYPAGVALKYDFSLIKDRVGKGETVSCRILLSALAEHSAAYVVRGFTFAVYWGANKPQSYPFVVTITNADTGAVLHSVSTPNFTINHYGTSEEISTTSDWIIALEYQGNKPEAVQLYGSFMGDKR